MEKIIRNRYPLFTASLCFAFGILYHFYLTTYDFLFYSFILSLGVYYAFIHRQRFFIFLVYLSCFIAGNCRTHLWKHLPSTDTIKIQVETAPNKGIKKYKSIATVVDTKSLLPTQKVLIQWYDSTVSIQQQDILVLKNQLQSIRPYQNGLFNRVQYWKSKGVLLEQTINKNSILEHQAHTFTLSALDNIRHFIRSTVNSYIDQQDARGLSMGLLIGDRKDISEETNKHFAAAGVSHLLAVSGMHTALLYQLVVVLLFPIGKRTTARLIVFSLSLIVLICFAALSGNTASVVRATIMCICFALSYLLKKKGNSLNTLGASMLLILFWNPTQILDIGFQLSCLAVIGIITIQPLLLLFRDMPFVWKHIGENSTITFAAQLYTCPMLLYHFKQLSIVFLFSNLLLIPLSTVLLLLLLLLLFFNSINMHFICEYIGNIIACLSSIFIKIGDYFGQLSFSSLEISTPSSIPVVMGLVVLIGVFYFPIEKRNSIIIGLMGIWISIQCFDLWKNTFILF
ncbi:MAG: competence protein ComEC family protein [Cytophagaceae bacterium]|nr:competence protein ComEC family protein [Cytophagaceae bacterium]